MKIFNKILLSLFVIMAIYYKAGEQPPMPAPPGGGGGGVGPGSTTSPIDMYVYFLAVIAVMFIIYYVKKYKKQLA